MSFQKDINYLHGTDEHEPHVRFREGLLTSLLVMAWMVEARDPYTGGHLWRVSRFARLLASDAGLPSAEVARVAIGGFLHDLGKISIPDSILGKKEHLTEQEYEVIKTHPDVGWRLLADHPLAALAEDAVRSHHETPDGKGYPRGLAGHAIAVDARIVGICDAFDAMTSTRPYRRGMSVERALSIIEENLGRQFDRDFGQRFVALGRSCQLDHIVGHSDEGIPLHECAMCGPTLVLKNGQAAGEHVYCRTCAGEYVIKHREGQLVTVSTGRLGAPKTLEPEADTTLINGFVRESARALLTI